MVQRQLWHFKLTFLLKKSVSYYTVYAILESLCPVCQLFRLSVCSSVQVVMEQWDKMEKLQFLVQLSRDFNKNFVRTSGMLFCYAWNNKSPASRCWARLFFSVVYVQGQGQIFIVQCEGLVASIIVCEYEQNPSRDDKVMNKIQVFAKKIWCFYSHLCPRSRSFKSQGQIFTVQHEGIVTRVVVCKYQQNPSRNE